MSNKRKSIWTAEERNLLKKYVDQWSSGGLSDRAKLLANVVCPDFFRLHPHANRTKRDEYKQSIKKWLSSTARRKSTRTRLTGRIRPSLKQVLAHERKDQVEAAVQKLSGHVPGDPLYLGEFQSGLKQVLLGLTDEEMDELEAKQRQWESRGYPREVQQRTSRRLGEYTQHVDHVRWIQMGAGVISWTFHLAPRDKFAYSFHNNIQLPPHLELESFQERHSDAFAVLDEAWVEYSEYVLDALCRDKGPAHIPKRVRGKVPLLQQSPDGYPLLPDIDKDEVANTAKGIQGLLREFLRQNYVLATGKETATVPYKSIAACCSLWIDSEYLPVDATLQDPSNMKKDDVRKLLKFWSHCRWTLDICSVSRGKGKKCPAGERGRGNGKGKGKEKGNTTGKKGKATAETAGEDSWLDPSLRETSPTSEEEDERPDASRDSSDDSSGPAPAENHVEAPPVVASQPAISCAPCPDAAGPTSEIHIQLSPSALPQAVISATTVVPPSMLKSLTNFSAVPVHGPADDPTGFHVLNVQPAPGSRTRPAPRRITNPKPIDDIDKMFTLTGRRRRDHFPATEDEPAIKKHRTTKSLSGQNTSTGVVVPADTAPGQDVRRDDCVTHAPTVRPRKSARLQNRT
ncbi:hypothetical protein NLJ89_g6877 [Agrocybe chaxingu]|uniref:Uncharacterized protein n=1 Tax=Agrocybe chaxingu TaxID=84603 RepID=A0A9W8MU84_9AGAR|nr:hypothetical protein NLJ89_g6877 [Agrocybe chaxingu]